MEKEGKYTLIIKERIDGFFAFKFQDPEWHKENCPLIRVMTGPGGFFRPRYFINEPDAEIEFCSDCENWRYIE